MSERTVVADLAPRSKSRTKDLSVFENGALLLLLITAIYADIATFGLGGETNSRWLSFLDSLSHCCAWAVDDATLSLREQVFGAFLSKYGSGLIVSALLGVTPGFMQTNTTLSFALALALSESTKRLAPNVRSRHGLWRASFITIGSLHKSRKLKFAISRCATVPIALIIGVAAMELTGWLVVVTRNIIQGRDVMSGWLLFVTRYRLRFALTVLAIALSIANAHPVLILAILILHKAFACETDGSSPRLEMI